MNEQEVKIKSAVAIFRGLTPSERAERLEALKHATQSDPVAERRRVAILLYPILSEIEKGIRLEEQRQAARIKAEVLRSLSAQQPAYSVGQAPEQYPQRSEEMRRAVRGVLILGGFAGGAVAVFHVVVSSGMVPVILGGAFVLFCISAMRGGSAPADTQPAQEAAAPQSIHINIAGHGGQINVTQS